MHRHIFALLPLLITLHVSAQDAETVVNAPECGFRLTIPDVGWTHREQRGAEGLSTLAIGPVARGGLVQLSVQITYVANDSVEEAQRQVRELRVAIAGDPSITDATNMQIEVAGHAAPGLRVVQAAAGEVFRAYVVFLRSRGIQYRIQFHAPRDEFDDQWTLAQRVLGGFELIDFDAAALERKRLQQLAARCGSEVDWAASWDEAAERAREGGRLIVVAIHAQPGFELGNRLNESVFTSPEILALMENRFVGWRWTAGQAAPFVEHGVFGLSGSTFGVGLLVCTPDGAVVRQLYLPTPTLVADGLRFELREHRELAPPPAPPEGTAAERGAFLIDTGQLEAARVLLDASRGESRPAALDFQAARLHRILRDGDGALRHLTKARAAHETDPAEDLLFIEEAVVQIGIGRNDLAATALERCLEAGPTDQSRAEAMLLQGVLAWAAGDVDRARERWSALTRERPEQRAAWVAAAGLIGPALELDLRPDLSWPTEATARMAIIPEPARPPLDVAAALVDAVRWLIDAQREDGGWDLPFGAGNTHPAPDPIAMASQAICTRALMRFSHELRRTSPRLANRSADAARRGLHRYLADRKLVREHPRPVAFMDYTCWGGSYGLMLLAPIVDPKGERAVPISKTTRRAVETEAAHLVEDLVRIQAGNGGWSYYVSGTVDGTSVGAAMSFTTATVLLALHGADVVGIDVADETLERGFACLASMRGPNGVFEYMRGGDEPHQAGATPPAGAAARGPVCTLALHRGGHLDARAVAPSFRTFVEHLGSFGRESRKALMHAGPAGQGSHYLLYDYSTAAQALRAAGEDVLDAGARRDVRAAILRELARCHNADGSFVDNPIIGCAPGTGLAVLTLLDLRE